jgi:tRNA nucleotidyltransferase (CCA-adding enzyme)
MSASRWSHYEHEADIGVLGIGKTKADAFIQAALAMTAIITEPDTVSPDCKIEIDCEDADDELLFVDWLNALIYQMATMKVLFSRFDVDIASGHLHACAWGEKIDRLKHQPAVEIKGATYTTLSVHQDEQGNWHAQTVVDV